MSEYLIQFLWDEEAAVWVATSEDIPGLVLESGSFDALVERCRIAAPEILELNGKDYKDVYLNFTTKHRVKAVA